MLGPGRPSLQRIAEDFGRMGGVLHGRRWRGFLVSGVWVYQNLGLKLELER